MIAALATIIFLTTLWLVTVLGAAVLEQSGAKIVAALKGQSGAPSAHPVSVRIRYRTPAARLARATRLRPRLNVAA